MNLVVDIGNSLTKTGLFEKNILIKKETLHTRQELQDFLTHTPVENLLVSSVSLDMNEVAAWSNASRKRILFNKSLALPVKVRYTTPDTLGADRIAAACGATFVFPNQHCLVIDVGTCINCEFVNKDGEYMGGSISPGVVMRFDAMHRYTAKLPKAVPVENAKLTGGSTIQCLQSGVMNGTLEEIKGTIHRYKIDYPDIRVILCGGDAHFFENHLKPSIFVAPDLVLMGLNSILLHNVNP